MTDRVRGPVLVLRMPADHRAPVGLVRVAAFSEAIGGGFLPNAQRFLRARVLTAELAPPERAPDLADTGGGRSLARVTLLVDGDRRWAAERGLGADVGYQAMSTRAAQYPAHG